MAKSDKFYLENFIVAAEHCCKAAAYLQECLTDYDYANIVSMLEKCADACEHVGDCIETIVMKNT